MLNVAISGRTNSPNGKLYWLEDNGATVYVDKLVYQTLRSPIKMAALTPPPATRKTSIDYFLQDLISLSDAYQAGEEPTFLGAEDIAALKATDEYLSQLGLTADYPIQKDKISVPPFHIVPYVSPIK